LFRENRWLNPLVFLVFFVSELEIQKPDYMTTIKLHSSVRKRLAKHATKDQTYEELIVELLDKIER